MIGDVCTGVDKILAEYMDEILEGNDTCFAVDSQLTSVKISLIFINNSF